jgi:O-6-methylguanine DNA methyltransferase
MSVSPLTVAFMTPSSRYSLNPLNYKNNNRHIRYTNITQPQLYTSKIEHPAYLTSHLPSYDSKMATQNIGATQAKVGSIIATSSNSSSQWQVHSLKSSSPPQSKSQPDDLAPYLSKIALSHQTPFQKRVLTLLCQVPRGEHTTYAAMSKHLSSSPRAVGNALRNNPFAPQVPCHRVLASDRTIGGFKGSWGRHGKEGLNDAQKKALLKGEGARFDSNGRVVGRVWDAFR